MISLALETAALRIEICPERGAAVTSLTIAGPMRREFPLLRPGRTLPRDRRDASCYVMAPFFGPIAGGRLAFRGRQHALAAERSGNAMHGVVTDRPWRLIERTPVSAVLGLRVDDRDAWPWPFDARIRYTLVGPIRPQGSSPANGPTLHELGLVLDITSRAEEPFPAGGGFHPFFQRRLWSDLDEPEITVPASGRWPVENAVHLTGLPQDGRACRMLRSGAALHDIEQCDSGTREFLGVFETVPERASTDGIVIRWPASGVRLTMLNEPPLDLVVVYTPRTTDGQPLSFFCVEPVSHALGGFAPEWIDRDAAGAQPGSGVAMLEPGRTLTLASRWVIEVAPG